MIFLFLLVSATVLCAHSSVQKRDELIQALEARINQLDTEPSLVKRIIRNQQNMSNLEDRVGITALKNQINALREQSCDKQKEDAAISPYRMQLDEVIAAIDTQTQEEKAEIKKLLEAQKKYKEGTPEFKAVSKKADALKKEALAKTVDLRKKKRLLNKKIQLLMKQEIDQARPLVKAMRVRYKENKDAITSALDELEKSVRLLKKKIVHDKQVRELRIRIREENRRLVSEDRCLLSKGTNSRGLWIQLFI